MLEIATENCNLEKKVPRNVGRNISHGQKSHPLCDLEQIESITHC